MPQFRVTAPDGTPYDVTAPEGATEQDALARVRFQHLADQQESEKAAAQPANDAAPVAANDDSASLANPNKPEASWLQTGIDTLKQVPGAMEKSAGGIVRFLGENQLGSGIAGPGVTSTPDQLRDQAKTGDEMAKSAGTPGTLANIGKQTSDEAQKAILANAPNVSPGSAKYYANMLGVGIAQTLPALGATVLTGNATPIIVQTAATSFGTNYADAMEQNPHDPHGAAVKATALASVDTAAAVIGLKAFGITPFTTAVGKISNAATGEFATVYQQTIADIIKNVMVQGVAIQPAIGLVNRGVDNWINGKPITDGMKDEYVTGAIQNTLLLGITHMATRPGATMGEVNQQQAGTVQGMAPGHGMDEGSIDAAYTAPAPPGTPRLPAPIDPRDVQPGDAESPIPTSIIAAGRKKMREADAARAQATVTAEEIDAQVAQNGQNQHADDILARNGWPQAGTAVTLDNGDGPAYTGTIHSGFTADHPEQPGTQADALRVRLDNGDMLTAFRHELDAAGVTITPQQAQEAGLPPTVATGPAAPAENGVQAQPPAAVQPPAGTTVTPENPPAQTAPVTPSEPAPPVTGEGTQASPITVTHPDHVAAAEATVNTNPTDAAPTGPGGFRTALSPEVKQKMADLYQSGASTASIAKDLNLPVSTISNHLTKQGIERRPRVAPNKLGDDERANAVRLYTDEQMTLPQVAKATGRGVTTIARWVGEAGKQRSMSEAFALAIQKGRKRPTALNIPWQSTKTGQWEFADSRYEAAHMAQLDEDPSVSSWSKVADRVPYTDAEGVKRTYVPDFMVEYADGRRVVEEVKPEGRVSEPNNQLKAAAAKAHFAAKNIEYRTVSEDDIGRDRIANFRMEGLHAPVQDVMDARRREQRATAARNRRSASKEITPQPNETGTSVPVPPSKEITPAKLPRDLAHANPRYNFGDRAYEINFASDIDRAAYITAQKMKSKRDADFLNFVQGHTAMSEAQVRQHGEAVRAAIKELARTTKPGKLDIPEVSRAAAAPAPAAEPSAPETKTILKTARSLPAPSTETSVLDNIRRMGGIKTIGPDGKPTKEGQDIAAVLKDVNRPGLINNKDGVPADTIRESLQEHGWFGQTGGHDIQDLYDLMDKEVREGPQFHPDSDKAKAAAEKAVTDANARALQDVHDEAKKGGGEPLTPEEAEQIVVNMGAHGINAEDAVADFIEKKALREQYEDNARENDHAPAATEPLNRGAGEVDRAHGQGREEPAPAEGGEGAAPAESGPTPGDTGEARLQTERDAEGLDQTIVPGAEKSAQQLAKAREAQGHGRATTSVAQKDAGGLFAAKTEETKDLFGGEPAKPVKAPKYTPEELSQAVEEYRALRDQEKVLDKASSDADAAMREARTGTPGEHGLAAAKAGEARKATQDHFDKIEAMARKWGAKGVDLDDEIAKPLYSRIGDFFGRGKGDKQEAAGGSEAGDHPDEYSEQVGLSADLKRMIDLFGPKMYGENMPQVTAKELLQNSFDGVKAALARGDIKPGEAQIDVHYDPQARTIMFVDNGSGMTPQIVKDAFLTVAGTDKGDLAAEDRSGGFGVAKLAFIFGNDGLRMATVRDGVKTTLETTGKELLDGKADLRTEKTNEPNGTTVEVKFPETFLDPKTGEQEHLRLPSDFSGNYTGFDAFNRPLIGDVAVHAYLKGWDGKEKQEVTPLGRHIDLSNTPKVTTAHFNWGDVDIYLGKQKGKYDVDQTVLSSGLFQFRTAINKPGKWERLPYDMILNVRPSVSADSALYPFNNQRENWSPKVKDDIKALEAYLQRHYSAEQAKSSSGTFANVEAMPVTRKLNPMRWRPDFENLGLKEKLPKAEGFDFVPDITIRDGKASIGGKSRDFSKEMEQAKGLNADSFSFPAGTVPTDRPIFHSNLNVDLADETQRRFAVPAAESRQFLAEVGTLVQDFRNALAKVPGYEETAKFPVGVSLDKEYHGVHIAVPYKGFFLNPLSVPARRSDGAVARDYLHTLIHEAAHHLAKSHDEAFTIALSKLDGDFEDHNPDLRFDLERKVRDLIERHREAFNALREVYNDAATKNLGNAGKEQERSLVGAGGVGQLPDGSLSGREAEPEQLPSGVRSGRRSGTGEGSERGDLHGPDEGGLSPSYSRVGEEPSEHDAAFAMAQDAMIAAAAKKLGWDGEPTSAAMYRKAFLMPKGPARVELTRNAGLIKALEDQRATPFRPGLTPIKGDGETKVRGAAQSAADKAAKSGQTLEDLPEYDVSKQAPIIARATKFADNDANYEQAKAVAMGAEPAPYGTTSEAMLIAVENRATREGDWKLLQQLGTKSALLEELTTMGQRISMMQQRDPTSPVAAIKSIQAARQAATKTKPADAPKAKKSAVKDMLDAIKKETDKSAARKKMTWNTFISSIACKE